MSVVRLAAVQATYVLMDREATIDRIADLTSAAAEEGAQVIVFPEVFVPGPRSRRHDQLSLRRRRRRGRLRGHATPQSMP
jgi:predicted amidohydrolase